MGRTTVLLHFDCNLFAEAQTRPWLRPALPSEAVVKKLLHGVMQGRGAECDDDGQVQAPLPSDVLLLNQGSCSDTQPKSIVEGMFPKLSCAHYKRWFLCLSEDTLRDRKKHVPRIVPQTQAYHVWSKERLERLEPWLPRGVVQFGSGAAAVARDSAGQEDHLRPQEHQRHLWWREGNTCERDA